jgi:hypothetical protein
MRIWALPAAIGRCNLNAFFLGQPLLSTLRQYAIFSAIVVGCGPAGAFGADLGIGSVTEAASATGSSASSGATASGSGAFFAAGAAGAVAAVDAALPRANARMSAVDFGAGSLGLCAAAGVSGQIFGVRGNEVYLYNQPRPIRIMARPDGWTPENLAEHWLPAVKDSFRSMGSFLRS